jgi:hypothetical protein
MMFDDMGKPIGSTQTEDQNETENDETGSLRSARSSIGSAPSTPRVETNTNEKSSEGFFVTMDGSAGSSSLGSKKDEKLEDEVNSMSIGGTGLLVTGKKNVVEQYRHDEKLARAVGPQQFHSLNTVRPNHLRPLVPKQKYAGQNDSVGGLQALGSGYVGYGTHIIEFANVPNLVIQRVQAHNGTIMFLGTALPTANSAKHAFPFVGCLDTENEKPFNITVLPSSTHQQTSVVANEFAFTGSKEAQLYIVGQALRDPTDSDTSEISLIRVQMQQSKMSIHESANFRLRGDFHQCLSSIKYSPRLNSMISVGSSQTRVLKAERKGVMTLTALPVELARGQQDQKDSKE